jgi:hypothetical protein
MAGMTIFIVLSLFTVVRFNNDACITGAGVNGTCYSSTECSNLRGTPSGSCASGFGVCCLCKLRPRFGVTKGCSLSQSGADVMIFKIFSPKKSAKKLVFFTQNKAKICKNFDHNIGF